MLSKISCVFGKIQDIAFENFNVARDDLKFSTKVRSLGDSLEIASFVLELEEEFGVDISDEQAQRIVTLGDIVRHVERSWSEKR